MASAHDDIMTDLQKTTQAAAFEIVQRDFQWFVVRNGSAVAGPFSNITEATAWKTANSATKRFGQ
jgi:hypothetical protein